jgi:hypothetical protein
LLTACSSETTVTLYEDEEWVVENVSRLNMSLLPEIGVGGDIVPGLMGLEISVDAGAWSETMLDVSLNQLVGYYHSQGVEASWESRPAGGGETAYTVRLEGTGWNRLCTVALTGTHASVVNMGNNQVRFSMDMPVDELGLGYLMDNTIHLHGQQIVQSNAQQVRGGRATWSNPQGTLVATVALSRRFNLGNPWVVGGVIVAGVAVVVTVTLLAVRPSLSRGRGPRRRTVPRRRPPSRRSPSSRRRR